MIVSPAVQPDSPPDARPADAADPGLRAVLGLLGSWELVAFTRLAGDAAAAPQAADRIELCRLGGVASARLARLGALAAERGLDLGDAVAPFLRACADVDARTPAGSWWERLLTSYIGFGVEDDVARLLAAALDPPARSVVLSVLDDDGHAALVERRVLARTATDRVLASRLALWGRRLVGESLGVVGRLVAGHPELADLLERSLDASDLPLQQRLFARLTAGHTRRMDRLGLTA